MKPDYQIVVAGGGPAGSWAAFRLAAAGASVLLCEAEGPDVDVLCSGLLNPESQQALGREVPQHVRREPLRPRLEFHDADNRLRRRYDPRYLNTHRPLFDAWLRELAAEAGAEVRYNTRAMAITTDGAQTVTRLADGEVTAQFAVDATGWRALSRKLARAPRVPQLHAFQGTIRSSLPEDAMWAIYRSELTPFYGWIVPKGGDQFLLGAGYKVGHESTRDQAADPWSKLEPFADYVRDYGYDVEPVDAKPRGSPISCINSTSELWWGTGRVFAAGEASGMVSPSSGDGISYSLQSSAAIASVLTDELRSGTPAEALSEAQRRAIDGRIHRDMAPALAELRFNCLKARIAASPLWRRLSTPLLPLYLRRRVDRMAYGGAN